MDTIIKDNEISRFDGLEPIASQFVKDLQKQLSEDQKHTEIFLKNYHDDLMNLRVQIQYYDDCIKKLNKEVEMAQIEQSCSDEKRKHLELEIYEKKLQLDEKLQEMETLDKYCLQLDSLIKDKEAEMNKSKGDMERVEKCVQMYRKYLGFCIIRSKSGTLNFIFSQIDRKDPSREFLLELTLDGDNHYILHRTVPDISNLDYLEKRLNETNNLLGFLVHLRSLFSDIC